MCQRFYLKNAEKVIRGIIWGLRSCLVNRVSACCHSRKRWNLTNCLKTENLSQWKEFRSVDTSLMEPRWIIYKCKKVDDRNESNVNAKYLCIMLALKMIPHTINFEHQSSNLSNLVLTQRTVDQI